MSSIYFGLSFMVCSHFVEEKLRMLDTKKLRKNTSH